MTKTNTKPLAEHTTPEGVVIRLMGVCPEAITIEQQQEQGADSEEMDIDWGDLRAALLTPEGVASQGSTYAWLYQEAARRMADIILRSVAAGESDWEVEARAVPVDVSGPPWRAGAVAVATNRRTGFDLDLASYIPLRMHERESYPMHGSALEVAEDLVDRLRGASSERG